MLGGFLLAFGWGMASSQGPAHIYPDKPLDLEDHQADAARPGCGTSGKLVWWRNPWQIGHILCYGPNCLLSPYT